MATFIPDGYTRTDGYVKGSIPNEETGERLYDALSFSYRVATPFEVQQVDHDVNQAFEDEIVKKKSGVGSEKIGCDWIAKRVTEWDLKAPDGLSVPITAENVTRIHPLLMKRVYSIIRNNELSDKKPEANKEPPSSEEMQKNLNGVSGDCSDTHK